MLRLAAKIILTPMDIYFRALCHAQKTGGLEHKDNQQNNKRHQILKT
jgi:hypothetical protein